MIDEKQGGHAFPNARYSNVEGMSLLDYFAGQALAGIMATDPARVSDWQSDVAWDAYSVARAMLAKRRGD